MIFVYLLGCIIFVVLQGFFAGSEISFVSSNPLRLRHRMRRGDKRAKVAYELIGSPEKFLATTLVGTNISVVISSSLATLFLIELNISKSNLWITFLFTPIVVIFSELIPKNIARVYREKFSCRLSSFIKFFEVIFLPLVTFIERTSQFIIKPLIGKKKRKSPFVTKEEIKSILSEVADEGILDRGEKEAIEDVFDLIEDKVKDVLTPFKKIVGLDCTDSQEKVLNCARKYGFTRFPVFSAEGASASGRGGKNKEITGYLNIFDLFYEGGNWLKFVRPITRVGESQKLYDVFTILKTKKENIALVLRGKKTLGVVTLDDITRRIITSIIKD